MNIRGQLFKDLRHTAALLLSLFGIDYTIKDNFTLIMDRLCECIDRNDWKTADYYVAGAMLRLWSLIPKLKMKSPLYGSTADEYATLLYDGIMYACKYRGWQDPDKHLTAFQCVYRCVETVRLQWQYDANLDKHKANYNNMSLEDPINNEDGTSFGDTIEDTVHSDPSAPIPGDEAREIIQSYVDKKKLVEAIILDTITFNDEESEKVIKEKKVVRNDDGTEKKVVTKTREFWEFKCVKLLKALPADYAAYFLQNYKVDETSFAAALEAVRSANNQKLYRYLRKTLSTARGSNS